MSEFTIPVAPNSIEKGIPLKEVLGKKAIEHLAKNISKVHSTFDKKSFINACLNGLEDLTLTQRANHISDQLHLSLGLAYEQTIAILTQTLSKPLEKTEGNGLASMFYMPHCSYIAKYGVDEEYNEGKDPFDISMKAQYEFTQRFTCEFSIRSFLKKDEKRTLKQLHQWMEDPNPHVRRLCSEGTRPRLPWASKLDSFVKDPSLVLPILEKLKDDEDLYVRRSVANHVGDIAKDHLDLALDLCESWLEGASAERKWLIRHAVRNPIKKGNQRAADIRKRAK